MLRKQNNTASLIGFVRELNERVKRLEDKTFKKKKPPTTLSQQILLLYHLGMLDKIYQLQISNVKKAELLAIILNGDSSNTKKAIESISKKDKSDIQIPFNYEFLKETFDEFELYDISEKMNDILKKIEASSNK
jgi:hypothetical protein